jgi:hypothetical protein
MKMQLNPYSLVGIMWFLLFLIVLVIGWVAKDDHSNCNKCQKAHSEEVIQKNGSSNK